MSKVSQIKATNLSALFISLKTFNNVNNLQRLLNFYCIEYFKNLRQKTFEKRRRESKLINKQIKRRSTKYLTQ